MSADHSNNVVRLDAHRKPLDLERHARQIVGDHLLDLPDPVICQAQERAARWIRRGVDLSTAVARAEAWARNLERIAGDYILTMFVDDHPPAA